MYTAALERVHLPVPYHSQCGVGAVGAPPQRVRALISFSDSLVITNILYMARWGIRGAIYILFSAAAQ